MNSYKQSLYSALIRVTANLLMVGAVFLAMYKAARGGSSEITFCLWFFGISVPLWACAFYLNRVIKRRFPAEHESLIDLPGQGRRLVRWRVLEASGRSALLNR